MKVNLGSVDRIVRISVGATLIGLVAGDVIGPWGYIGIVPIATALLGFCPAYRLLGFSSCPMKRR